MLARVVRPDGKDVAFGYDALGRRVWKNYRGKTTRWIWDGNVPVHEWVEVDPGSLPEPAPEKVAEAEDAGLRQRAVDLAKRTSQGPPSLAPPSVRLAPRSGERAGVRGGTALSPITWVFEPESLAPAAKLVGGQKLAIITDHLGTPTAMLDVEGRSVWSADIGIYGELRNVEGDKQACPFRWPGQYEDEETGLYYNRFRHYDPESGEYVSQDPIGLDGGIAMHGYVFDPLSWFDPFGLAGCHGNSKLSRKPNHVYVIRNKKTGEVHQFGISGGMIRKDGKSYRAELQVRQLNKKAGGDVFESAIVSKNLTRESALNAELGRVNAFSIAQQRSGMVPTGTRIAPLGNVLPRPTM